MDNTTLLSKYLKSIHNLLQVVKIGNKLHSISQGEDLSKLSKAENNMLNYTHVSVFLLSIAIFVWSISFIYSELKISDFGLIHGISYLFYISIYLVIISFFVTLIKNTKNSSLLFLNLLCLTVFFACVPVLIERTPRFPYNFLTSYNIDFISQLGHVNFFKIQYQSWPGLFYLGAILYIISGFSLNQILLFLPIIFKLAMLPLLFLLFASLLENKREVWATFLFGGVLFFGGPSYLVPGVLGSILASYTLFILIRYELIQDRRSPGIATLFIVFSTATVISHFLSAVTLFISVFMICIAASLYKKKIYGLVHQIFLIVIIVFWQIYIVGSFALSVIASVSKELFNLDTISSGIKEMGFSGSVEHTNVVFIRIFSAIIVATLAIMGLSNQIIREKTINFKKLILLCWISANSLPILITSYSGEILSRIFSSNNVLLNILSSKNINSNLLSMVLLGVLFISPMLSLINAYGNEEVDYVSPVEIRGADFLISYSEEDSRIFSFQQRAWSSKYSKNLTWNPFLKMELIEKTKIIRGQRYKLFGERDISSYAFLYGQIEIDKYGQIGIDKLKNELENSYNHIYENCGFSLYL